METRVVRDKSKAGDDTPQVTNAVVWASLIQEATKDVWGLTDEQVVDLVNAQIAEMLDYEATHDEWGNPVDGIMVRLGKGGYSVETVFDSSLDTQE